MIEFNDLYLADIKDDFEEAGRGNRNFDLWDFINNDLSRAFALGYLYFSLAKKGVWIPVSIRKQMRRMHEGMEKYNSQLDWLHDKYKGDKDNLDIEDYINFIMGNIFEDNEGESLKLAIVLGANFGNYDKS